MIRHKITKKIAYPELSESEYGLWRMRSSTIRLMAPGKVRVKGSCTRPAHAPAAEAKGKAHGLRSAVNCLPNTGKPATPPRGRQLPCLWNCWDGGTMGAFPTTQLL